MFATPIVGPSAVLCVAVVLFSGANPAMAQACREWVDVGPSPKGAIVYHASLELTLNLRPGPAPAENLQTWGWDGADWFLLDEDGPSNRVYASVVYDSRREVVVLFGGYDGQQPLADTWEWDASGWVPKAAEGPPARSNGGMAFDSRRGVTVLYGGETYSRPLYLGDTWEWDGSTWTFRTDGGPGLRTAHAMAFDEGRGVVVTFGGFYNEELGDLWEWDGNNWVLRYHWLDDPNPGPSARVGPAMVYDGTQRAVVLHGGVPYECCGNELWYWKGAQWLLLDISGPQRDGHSLAYDSSRDVLVANGPAYEIPLEMSEWQIVRHFPTDGPIHQLYPPCNGQSVPGKNRIISFIPPMVPEGASGVALCVWLAEMPYAGECLGVPDYSAFDGREMWVGNEVLNAGGKPTGRFALQAEPLFRDWTTVPDGVVHVSDCNIVPCAHYIIYAAGDGFPPYPYSPQLTVGTNRWGDVIGSGTYAPAPDGVVNAMDIGGVVDCVKAVSNAPPRAWCDLYGALPSGGADGAINAMDIGAAVQAVKGQPCPYPGPSAPRACDEQ